MRRLLSVALRHACVLSAEVMKDSSTATLETNVTLWSNKETAASTPLFPIISIPKPCGSYQLGTHITRTIKAAEWNAKLRLTAKWCCTRKPGLMKNKQTETFFSFPAATNGDLLGTSSWLMWKLDFFLIKCTRQQRAHPEALVFALESKCCDMHHHKQATARSHWFPGCPQWELFLVYHLTGD